MLDCFDEMNDAFLTSDAADEKYVGLLFIDAEAVKRFSGILLVIFVRVDAVVNDVELRWVDVEVLHDV